MSDQVEECPIRKEHIVVIVHLGKTSLHNTFYYHLAAVLCPPIPQQLILAANCYVTFLAHPVFL